MHRNRTLWLLCLVVLTAMFALVGCASDSQEPDSSDVDTPAGADDSPAGGLRLADGLYDLEDGTAQALGRLEYVDLEGGFWAVVTGGTGEDAETVVVIANGDEFAEELEALEGKTVSVVGTRLDGVSVRQAGPEMEMETIEELSDTGAEAM